MIRDPSDGTVTRRQTLQEKYGPNWGLKSLDQEARKPKPAPTKEELEAYYATHTLGGKLKEEI